MVSSINNIVIYISHDCIELLKFKLPQNVYLTFCVSGALEEECESQGREKEQQLNGKQRHQLKHRELFLSRQVETLPATHIRGKCSVTLLNETESLLSYLNKDVRSTFLAFISSSEEFHEPHCHHHHHQRFLFSTSLLCETKKIRTSN